MFKIIENSNNYISNSFVIEEIKNCKTEYLVFLKDDEDIFSLGLNDYEDFLSLKKKLISESKTKVLLLCQILL